ncbi:MAG: FAD-binding oxidoreductase [Lawsonella sp.]
MGIQEDIKPRMRWWGWGVDGFDKPIKPAAVKILTDVCGMDIDANTLPPNVEDVKINPSALDADDIAALKEAVGDEFFKDDHYTRVMHTYGRSYPDLLRLRLGVLEIAPDAIVYPGNEDQVAKVIKVCEEREIAIIPFGGGTSVAGGVEAVRGGFKKAISLSTLRFNKIKEINKDAMTVTVEPGVFGPDLEEELGKHGVTVGHFPQSFEFSTVGGWVSCRSSGQESSGYGRIDKNVIGLRVVTPKGVLDLRDMPSSAAGPDPREFFLGSEGVLGIITEATIQIHHKPDVMVFDSYFFNSFEEGIEVFRELKQKDQLPHLARLSNEKETYFGIEQLGGGKLGEVLTKYLNFRGIDTPCMAVLGFGGGHVEARAEREAFNLKMIGKNCVRLGPTAGNIWVKERFTSPYLRDVMMTKNIAVDTLETCTTWDNALNLHKHIIHDMEAAGNAHGTPLFLFCHVSHTYQSGCSLYYTYFMNEKLGEEMQQWSDVKDAATMAMENNGGTCTHHHGVGQDHAPGLRVENGDLWTDFLRAAKKFYDPKGVLNPAKLQDGPVSLRARYEDDDPLVG